MKLAKGITENGVIIGNKFDKYGSRNPIVRKLMKGFESAFFDLVHKVNPQEVHEVGCGEGYWTLQLYSKGINVRGSDFSQSVIELARENAAQSNVPASIFKVQDIYSLDPTIDRAELVVCCEVLEHLEFPEKALQVLASLANPHVILSVPREPIWSILNMVRGKYWSSLGNTPGHLNRWSQTAFVDFVSQYFTIQAIHTPLPWTMLWATRS